MSIPVVFYHDGNQEYLQFAIKAAEKYNEKVVLLGTKKNKGMCKLWYDTEKFDKSYYKQFENVYLHLSSNSKKFEITAFKKYFMLLEYLKQSGENTCILLDSDILTYVNFSEMGLFLESEASVSKPMCQGQYDWVASGHTFFCTRKILEDFTNFLIQTYKTDIGVLREKYTWHINYHVKGGICDMTLLYLWGKDIKEVLNWLENNEYVIDHSLQTGSHRYEKQFAMDPILRIKKIKYKNETPHFFDIVKKEWVPAATLHFQGSSKILMKDYMQNVHYSKMVFDRYKEYLLRALRIRRNVNKT